MKKVKKLERGRIGEKMTFSFILKTFSLLHFHSSESKKKDSLVFLRSLKTNFEKRRKIFLVTDFNIFKN